MGTKCSKFAINRESARGPVVLANSKAPRWDHLPDPAAVVQSSFFASGFFASGRFASGRFPSGLIGSLLGIACFFVSASAAEAVLSVEGAPGISIIPADEVLASYTQPSLDGELLFEDPSGSLVRLITSTDDPEISNPGDGSFHPADANAIAAALHSLPPSFLAPLLVQVFVLPYPRAGMIASSATAHAIYISPGVYPLEDGATLRAMVVHELSHVIHQHFLSSDPSTWNTYIAIREIGDDNVFHPNAAHAFRPAEIFAEDFRGLFGDELASSTPIENPTLAAPEEVPGLDVWFTNLAAHYTFISSVEDGSEELAMHVYPNPVRGGAELTVVWASGEDAGHGGGDLAAESEMGRLYDVSGRLVAELAFHADGATWNTTMPSLSSGTYWLRPAGVNVDAVPVRVTR